MSDPPLLQVQELSVHFPFSRGTILRPERGLIRAVDGISFEIGEGETLGLVGESGCGKSTTARAIVGLVKPTSGRVLLNGVDITGLSDAAMLPHRRAVQMVFQDPFASLNPRMTVGNIIGEPLAVHRLASGRDRKLEVMRLMELVGLNPRFLNRYPHEFSGGQRQRIGIARALAVQPKLILCDEPVSALDVSIQAQIINLLMELQQRLGLSYLFIAHDLSVVRHIATRVGVMYLGRIAEIGESKSLYQGTDSSLHRSVVVGGSGARSGALRKPKTNRAGRGSPLARPPVHRLRFRRSLLAGRKKMHRATSAAWP